MIMWQTCVYERYITCSVSPYAVYEASAITSKYLLAMGLLVYGMITSSVVLGEEERGLYAEWEKKC